MPVVEDEGKSEKVEPRNPNEIRDLIYTVLSVTEYSKIPMLLLGNPGVAKTTGVREWAKHHKYKVTTLIGTQRVAEEILGYMVNDTGEKRLITYTPDWFDEIQENKKEGFKTLLFVDELSQAPDNVQGAMLQLIFDRKVGGRDNYLPDDCLVVSAANYKGNIPPQCGIQAPTLNRFCIINVHPKDGPGLIEEFLQTEDERLANIPVFEQKEISINIQNSIRQNMKEIFFKVFEKFSTADIKERSLDIKNTDFADIFDQPGPIYNFITGRTISYLYHIFEACIHLGLIRMQHKNVITNMCLGLIGLGTNSFRNEKDKEDYMFLIQKSCQKIIRNSVEENRKEINAAEINFAGKSVEKCISDWMRHNDANGNTNDINLHRLVQIIEKSYDPSVSGMTKTIEAWDTTRILADLNKMETLFQYLKAAKMIEIAPFIKKLEIINNTYASYKTIILQGM